MIRWQLGWLKVLTFLHQKKGKLKDVFKVMFKQIERNQKTGRVELCFNWDYLWREREQTPH